MAGEVLKKRREKLGIDLKEVTDSLKISSEYLSAIEDDVFVKLPAAVYTIGYIRCYAKYLNVDAEPIISNFTAHLSAPKPSAIMPVSFYKRKAPRYFYFISFLLAGLLAFVVYTYMFNNQTTSLTDKNTGVSGTEKQPLLLPPPPSETMATATHEDNAPLKNMQALPAPVIADSKEHRLEVMARDITWVLIQFEDNRSEEVMLKSGISKSWEFNGLAALKIGNAGGVTLKFNGKDLGTPGTSGQVLRLNFPPG